MEDDFYKKGAYGKPILLDKQKERDVARLKLFYDLNPQKF